MPLRSAGLRWAACAAVVAAVVVAGVAVAGDAVAETVVYLSARHPLPAAALERAHALEPENPEASYRLALYYMDAAQPPDLDAAGRLLDESLARGPNRFQGWLSLGRQRELAGRDAEAEPAYLRAAALAPSYWRPKWALGNLYVRQGRVADGVEALRLASERNPDLAPLAVQTVWRASDGSLDLTSQVAGESFGGRAALATWLFAEKETDRALAVWQTLAAENASDETVSGLGRGLAGALLAAGRAREALDVMAKLSAEPVPAADTIRNPGFEEPVAERSASPFSWSVTQSPEARVSLDAGRAGGKALRVDYTAKGGSSFGHASEYAIVRPGAAYTLSFWAKTDDLQSGGLPAVAVGDAANRAPGSAARVLPAGTTEWTEYRISFKAPSSGLVAIGVSRTTCGDVCPIFGTFRIDDLTLVAN